MRSLLNDDLRKVDVARRFVTITAFKQGHRRREVKPPATVAPIESTRPEGMMPATQALPQRLGGAEAQPTHAMAGEDAQQIVELEECVRPAPLLPRELGLTTLEEGATPAVRRRIKEDAEVVPPIRQVLRAAVQP